MSVGLVLKRKDSATEIKIGDVQKSLRPPKRPQYSPHKYLSMGELSQNTLRHLRWMLQKDILKQDIFLIGRPGPTRRQLAMVFLEMAGREVEYVSLSRDTTEADLKQRREILGGTAKYFDQEVVSGKSCTSTWDCSSEETRSASSSTRDCGSWGTQSTSSLQEAAVRKELNQNGEGIASFSRDAATKPSASHRETLNDQITTQVLIVFDGFAKMKKCWINADGTKNTQFITCCCDFNSFRLHIYTEKITGRKNHPEDSRREFGGQGRRYQVGNLDKSLRSGGVTHVPEDKKKVSKTVVDEDTGQNTDKESGLVRHIKRSMAVSVHHSRKEIFSKRNCSSCIHWMCKRRQEFMLLQWRQKPE
ncbi:hypothetical protein RUM43_000394 [Polyplax serrata]|uniref:ATPase dynein-related AAA domain-containing protein n=1 Tax=Polyplax serrata TaxID=468196 RepID=A0AAN8XS79_POLSC